MRFSIPSYQTVWKLSLLILQDFAKYSRVVCSPVRLFISLRRFPVTFFLLCFNRSFSKGKSLSMKFFSCMDLWYATSASLSTRSFMISGCMQCFCHSFSTKCPSTHWKADVTVLSAMMGFTTCRTSNCACFSFSSFLAWVSWFSTPLLSQYVGTS